MKKTDVSQLNNSGTNPSPNDTNKVDEDANKCIDNIPSETKRTDNKFDVPKCTKTVKQVTFLTDDANSVASNSDVTSSNSEMAYDLSYKETLIDSIIDKTKMNDNTLSNVDNSILTLTDCDDDDDDDDDADDDDDDGDDDDDATIREVMHFQYFESDTEIVKLESQFLWNFDICLYEKEIKEYYPLILYDTHVYNFGKSYAIDTQKIIKPKKRTVCIKYDWTSLNNDFSDKLNMNINNNLLRRKVKVPLHKRLLRRLLLPNCVNKQDLVDKESEINERILVKEWEIENASESLDETTLEMISILSNKIEHPFYESCSDDSWEDDDDNESFGDTPAIHNACNKSIVLDLLRTSEKVKYTSKLDSIEETASIHDDNATSRLNLPDASFGADRTIGTEAISKSTNDDKDDPKLQFQIDDPDHVFPLESVGSLDSLGVKIILIEHEENFDKDTDVNDSSQANYESINSLFIQVDSSCREKEIAENRQQNCKVNAMEKFKNCRNYDTLESSMYWDQFYSNNDLNTYNVLNNSYGNVLSDQHGAVTTCSRKEAKLNKNKNKVVYSELYCRQLSGSDSSELNREIKWETNNTMTGPPGRNRKRSFTYDFNPICEEFENDLNKSIPAVFYNYLWHDSVTRKLSHSEIAEFRSENLLYDRPMSCFEEKTEWDDTPVESSQDTKYIVDYFQPNLETDQFDDDIMNYQNYKSKSLVDKTILEAINQRCNCGDLEESDDKMPIMCCFQHNTRNMNDQKQESDAISVDDNEVSILFDTKMNDDLNLFPNKSDKEYLYAINMDCEWNSEKVTETNVTTEPQQQSQDRIIKTSLEKTLNEDQESISHFRLRTLRGSKSRTKSLLNDNKKIRNSQQDIFKTESFRTSSFDSKLTEWQRTNSFDMNKTNESETDSTQTLTRQESPIKEWKYNFKHSKLGSLDEYLFVDSTKLTDKSSLSTQDNVEDTKENIEVPLKVKLSSETSKMKKSSSSGEDSKHTSQIEISVETSLTQSTSKESFYKAKFPSKLKAANLGSLEEYLFVENTKQTDSFQKSPVINVKTEHNFDAKKDKHTEQKRPLNDVVESSKSSLKKSELTSSPSVVKDITDSLNKPLTYNDLLFLLNSDAQKILKKNLIRLSKNKQNDMKLSISKSSSKTSDTLSDTNQTKQNTDDDVDDDDDDDDNDYIDLPFPEVSRESKNNRINKKTKKSTRKSKKSTETTDTCTSHERTPPNCDNIFCMYCNRHDSNRSSVVHLVPYSNISDRSWKRQGYKMLVDYTCTSTEGDISSSYIGKRSMRSENQSESDKTIDFQFMNKQARTCSQIEERTLQTILANILEYQLSVFVDQAMMASYPDLQYSNEAPAAQSNFTNFVCSLCKSWVNKDDKLEHLEWCIQTQKELKKKREEKILQGINNQPNIKSMPGTVCYLCGRFYTQHSINIHMISCRQKWMNQMSNKLSTKPHRRHRRGSTLSFRNCVPKPPEISESTIESMVEEEIRKGNDSYTKRDAINKLFYQASILNQELLYK